MWFLCLWYYEPGWYCSSGQRGHGVPPYSNYRRRRGPSSTRETRQDPDLDTWLAPLIGSLGIISPSECREGEQKRRHLRWDSWRGYYDHMAYDTSQVLPTYCTYRLRWPLRIVDSISTMIVIIQRSTVHIFLSLSPGLTHHSCSWIAKKRLDQRPIDRLAFNRIAGQPKHRQYNHRQKENHPKCRPVLRLGVSAFHAFQLRWEIGCHKADREE